MSTYTDRKIPERFKQSPLYPAFLKAAEEYKQLSWDKASDPEIAKNLAGLGAFFAYDFGQNAATSLEHILRQYKITPPTNAESLKYLTQLCSEELAEGLQPSDPLQAHFWPALKAAEDAGYNIAPILKAAGYKLEGNGPLEQRVQSIKRDESGLAPHWAKFLTVSRKYEASKDASLGVLGLARELLLDSVFEEISKSIPNDAHFGQFKHFLDCHVTIDGSGEGHGDKMARILERDVEDVDVALKAATEFLQNRKALYEVVLQPEKYHAEDVKLQDRPIPTKKQNSIA